MRQAQTSAARFFAARCPDDCALAFDALVEFTTYQLGLVVGTLNVLTVLPIVLGLLPGFHRGILLCKRLLPVNPLPGYLLLLRTVVGLPLVFLLGGAAVQLTRSFFIVGSVGCFMVNEVQLALWARPLVRSNDPDSTRRRVKGMHWVGNLFLLLGFALLVAYAYLELPRLLVSRLVLQIPVARLPAQDVLVLVATTAVFVMLMAVTTADASMRMLYGIHKQLKGSTQYDALMTDFSTALFDAKDRGADIDRKEMELAARSKEEGKRKKAAEKRKRKDTKTATAWMRNPSLVEEGGAMPYGGAPAAAADAYGGAGYGAPPPSAVGPSEAEVYAAPPPALAPLEGYSAPAPPGGAAGGAAAFGIAPGTTAPAHTQMSTY
eukprot:PLAT12524.9.p1 GENE.PLAT12524.9~~PLAT12524.9.p1  ORF type:complete len:377 (+),score=129.83 PLAT12524.9:583-1713(+)